MKTIIPKTLIRHRVNRLVDLATVRPEWGVEIDLRSQVDQAGEIHLSHDPWVRGDSFAEWLREFKRLGIRGPIILNTKEDGLETRALELIESFGISRYFFLDTALPTLVNWTQNKARDYFALRISAFEPGEGLSPFVGKAQWLWVDCFGGVPLLPEVIAEFKGKFKICLVSPELQAQPLADIQRFAGLYALADAVCTKNPEAWEAEFSEGK